MQNAECKMQNDGVGFADELKFQFRKGVGIVDSHRVSADSQIVLRGRRIGAPTFSAAEADGNWKGERPW